MSVFEAGMLICFGAAWPVSIYKSFKSKSNQGKSIFFLYILLFGYIMGVLHKIIYSFDYVIILYILNASMVTIDILLFHKNKSLTS